MFPNFQIAPHASSSNNVDANTNQFNNNNENLAVSSSYVSIDDCVTSRNYNEIGYLYSGIKDEMNNKENSNEKSISLDIEWEVYHNSRRYIAGASKACTM